jgi:hypothetical protein
MGGLLQEPRRARIHDTRPSRSVFALQGVSAHGSLEPQRKSNTRKYDKNKTKIIVKKS